MYKDLQEIFDTIFTVINGLGMKEQNFDSLNKETISYEHLPFGCFIGLLLSEDLAERLQEETITRKIYSITSIFENSKSSKVFQEVVSILSNASIAHLQFLQNIHDGTNPNNWNRALRSFANVYGLTVPNMDTEEWKNNVDKLMDKFF